MVICVAGPIAAGKNFVCSILEERGFFCLDADQEIHKIIGDKQAEILSRFSQIAASRGINLRAADGSLDRRALGKLLFKDSALLAEQEKILYPEFVARVQALIDANNNALQAQDAAQKTKGFTGQNAAADFSQPEGCGISNNSINAQEGGATEIAGKPKIARGSVQPIAVGQPAADFSASEKAWVDQNAGGGNFGFGIDCGPTGIESKPKIARGLAINAALLYKTPSLLRQCKKIIYVDAPLLVRAWRIRRRDRLPLLQIIRRIKSQKGLMQEYKRFAADYGIEMVRVRNWGRGVEFEMKMNKGFSDMKDGRVTPLNEAISDIKKKFV